MNPEEIKRLAELRAKSELNAEEKKELDGLGLKETTSVVKTAVLESKEEMLKDVKEEVATLIKTVEAQDEKIKAFENAPATAKQIHIQRIASTHMGRKLINLNEKMRNKAAEQPHIFPVFASDEKSDEFSKFMLDYIAATKRNPDMAAKQRLEEYLAKANEGVNKSTLLEGTDAQGGYLVPDEYQWEIIKLSRDNAFALKECTVTEMASNTLTYPAEATLATVEWDAEDGTIGQLEGTFGEVKLTARRCNALALLSNELLADSAIDVVGLLLDQFSSAINLSLDNQILNGTGAPISGFTVNSSFATDVSVAGSNYSDIKLSDFSDMIANVEEQGDQYLNNAKFLVNWRTKKTIRTAQNTVGDYVFAQAGANVPGTLWEFPYITSNQITSTDATANYPAIFGNLKYVVVGRRQGVFVLEADPFSYFTTNKTQFRIVTRWGAAFGLKTPFCRLLTV